MQALRWGLIYFIAIFAVGFLLGFVRVVFVVPRIGVRWAELLEMPVMLIAIVLIARWIVHKTRNDFSRKQFLGVGVVALAILLAAETSLVLSLNQSTLSEYVLNRDPVSGSAYLISLGLFACMPWLIARARSRSS